jgi:hypothetical protein
MADQPPTPSGSRWEPDPNEHPTAETPSAPVDEPADALAPGPAGPPAYGDPAYGDPDAEDDLVAEERRARLRRRGGLAGAAAAIALGAGLTGFVVGHSTAGDRHDGFVPANFTGQVPGNGRLGQGQQQPPGFGERDGGHDGDHDGNGGPFGQQAPGAGGSSGSSSGNGSGSAASPGNPT